MRARLVWTLLAALSGVILPCSAGLAQAQAAPDVDAKIEIVWPHDAQGNEAPAASAPLVNVEAYLFQRGTLNSVGCNFQGTPNLHAAVNYSEISRLNGVEEGIQQTDEIENITPQRSTRTVDGKSFPVWTFNDVPISPGPGSIYVTHVATYFFADVPGYDVRSNVWGHGADPRTFAPNQIAATNVASTPGTPVDSIIEIVYPHDRQGALQPVTQAPLANVSVTLFSHPICATTNGSNPKPPCYQAEPFNFSPAPQLLKSLNTGYLDLVGQPANEVQSINSSLNLAYPRYDFNDVNVAAASDSLNKYYFAVRLPGVESHTTIWAHGADPRTNFPMRDILTSNGAGC